MHYFRILRPVFELYHYNDGQIGAKIQNQFISWENVKEAREAYRLELIHERSKHLRIQPKVQFSALINQTVDLMITWTRSLITFLPSLMIDTCYKYLCIFIISTPLTDI